MGNKGIERRYSSEAEAESLSKVTLLAVIKGDKRTVYDIIVDEEVIDQVRTGKKVIIGRDEITQNTVVFPWNKSFAMATESLPHVSIRDITQLGGEIGERAKTVLRRAQPVKPQIRKTSK